jgi:hypothetical protein
MRTIIMQEKGDSLQSSATRPHLCILVQNEVA